MSTQSPRGTTPGTLQTLKTMAFALMGGLVIFGVIAIVLGESWDYPASWIAWALGGLAVVVYGLCELIGYRAPAIPPGADVEAAMGKSRTVFQSQLMVRFAMCELPALVGLVLFFMNTPLTAMTYLIGGVLSLVLMLIHVWPSERVIGRMERNLDRDGGRSHLSEALRGRAPSTDLRGPIR